MGSGKLLPGRGVAEGARRQGLLFLKKKKQERLFSLLRQNAKVFCCFFSKKQALLP
jgi:hypothetical protein